MPRSQALIDPALAATFPKVAMNGMFKRYFETGRLAIITHVPCEGKLCTMIDIVDQKRAVVDGPQDMTGVPRHMMSIKCLSLTDSKSKIVCGAREKTPRKALDQDEVLKKWGQISWAKKIRARESRASMTDFDRFKLMVAKRKRAKQVRAALRKPKK